MVGFPAMGEYSLMLEDVVFKATGSGRDIACPISGQDAMKGDYDAKLIQIKGRLVNQDQTSEYPTLVMSSGGILFFAMLPSGTIPEKMAAWQPGSELQLTGICSVQVDKYLSTQYEGAALPMSFRVLLRSPEDVAVLSTPSWWTASRILAVLAICVLIIFFCSLWLLALKRRVIERTETFRAALESTADGILVCDSAKGLSRKSETRSHVVHTGASAQARRSRRYPGFIPQLKDGNAFSANSRLCTPT